MNTKALSLLVASVMNPVALAQDYRPLPPKLVEPHPRLAPHPAIHFDHFNTSVSDYPMPIPGKFVVTRRELDRPSGICLNFLIDAQGRISGFCGESRGLFGQDWGVSRLAFYAVTFDENLRIVDRYKLRSLSAIPIFLFGELPPLNLGYFVMDDRGRLIVAKKQRVIFLARAADGELSEDAAWELKDQIRNQLERVPDLTKKERRRIAKRRIAQVIPAYESGYWLMTLGKSKKKNPIPAYVARLDDSGQVQDIHVFPGEVIENGMTLDANGPLIVTDYAVYRLAEAEGGGIEVRWRYEYTRASYEKPGTLSRHGSGSTPTLIGTDLVAFTDNFDDGDTDRDDDRVNLVILDRESGDGVCRVPLFRPGRSANENTVVSYRDSVIVQNWYNSPSFKGKVFGLEPGVERIDIRPDRSGCDKIWQNYEFASPSTLRLSTRTGLLYAATQVTFDEVADDPGLIDFMRSLDSGPFTSSDTVARMEHYAMTILDFHSGAILQKIWMGVGKGTRLSYAPAYFVPESRLIQPIRRGFVIFENDGPVELEPVPEESSLSVEILEPEDEDHFGRLPGANLTVPIRFVATTTNELGAPISDIEMKWFSNGKLFGSGPEVLHQFRIGSGIDSMRIRVVATGASVSRVDEIRITVGSID